MERLIMNDTGGEAIRNMKWEAVGHLGKHFKKNKNNTMRNNSISVLLSAGNLFP